MNDISTTPDNNNPTVKRVFWVLFISTFAAMLGVGIIVPFLPQYAHEMGATGRDIGFIVAGFAIARMIALPMVSTMADRVGHKRLFLIGLLGYTCLSLAYIGADSVIKLNIVRFLHGFAAAIILPMSMSFIGDIAPPNEEGALMGRFNIALFTGFGTGPLLGGFLNDQFGYDAAFIGMGILSMIAFALVAILLPSARVFHPDADNIEDSNPETELVKENLEVFTGLWKIKFFRPLRSRVVFSVFLYRIISALGRSTSMTFIPLFGVAVLGITPTKVGLILTSQLFLSALLQPFFGKIADRRDKVMMVLIGSFITGSLLLVLPNSTTFIMALTVCLGIGLASSITMPAVSAIAVSEGRSYGMLGVMALFQTAFGLGQILGPTVGGELYDMYGLKTPFYYASVATFVGAGIFYYYVRDAYVQPDAQTI